MFERLAQIEQLSTLPQIHGFLMGSGMQDHQAAHFIKRVLADDDGDESQQLIDALQRNIAALAS